MSRADKFLELYNDGLTQEQIGDRYDISRQMVCKVLANHPDYKTIPRSRRLIRRNQAIIDAKNIAGLGVDEIAKAFNVGVSTVYRIIAQKSYRL